MTILRTLADEAKELGLEFIVCGGHAVNAYQVIRKTADVDLVVRESDAVQWKAELTRLGYSVFHESEAFLQFEHPMVSAWPIDLLLVDNDTFDTMKRSASLFTFANATCLIPSLDHLIAMKLHALKSSGEARMRKDAFDVIDLAEKAGIDLDGESFRSLCQRFADERIRERLLLYAGKRS